MCICIHIYKSIGITMCAYIYIYIYTLYNLRASRDDRRRDEPARARPRRKLPRATVKQVYLSKAPRGNERGAVGSKKLLHNRTLVFLCSAWF